MIHYVNNIFYVGYSIFEYICKNDNAEYLKSQ